MVPGCPSDPRWIFLAFFFGYSFTMHAVRKAGRGFEAAVRTALAAETMSITVMELLAPGALAAHLSDGLFWGAFLGGFAVAFVITTPLNMMIGRGKGHAVVHAYH